MQQAILTFLRRFGLWRQQPSSPQIQQPKQYKILLAFPCYGSVNPGAAAGAYRYPTKQHKLAVIPGSLSLLAFNFNCMFCQALNNRVGTVDDGFTHFAMLHEDIAPAPLWLDTLLAEMDLYGADLMSAVVPIKAATGITSTAMDYYPSHVKRLTMTEILALPETFCAADTPWPTQRLLVNTGCMVMRLDRPWLMDPAPPCFSISDTITQNEAGEWKAQVEPEDWKLSRELNRRGASVYATRKVKLEHWGEWGWGNDHVYGDAEDKP